MQKLATLYRPVGQKELDLVAESGYWEFPPRLPGQPIFYPALALKYAEQIARDWNTEDERSGFRGYVLEFQVDEAYLSQFAQQKVGGTHQLECWIPAQDLAEFNRHIVGAIRVIRKFPESPAS